MTIAADTETPVDGTSRYEPETPFAETQPEARPEAPMAT